MSPIKSVCLALVLGWSIAPAGARAESTHVEFLPIPNTMPALLFAPDPLAGTLLRPFSDPDLTSGATPRPAADTTETGTVPDTASEEPAAEPPPTAEAAPEPSAGPPKDQAEAEPGPAPEPEPPPPPKVAKTATVTVIVENVQTDEGTVNVAICDKSLSREGCPYTTSQKAKSGFIEAQFHDIPPGRYAVVGYHDVNDNKQFDKFLGMPREPYALSSKAADELVPSFEDAALPLKKGDNVVIIRLKKLGG